MTESERLAHDIQFQEGRLRFSYEDDREAVLLVQEPGYVLISVVEGNELSYAYGVNFAEVSHKYPYMIRFYVARHLRTYFNELPLLRARSEDVGPAVVEMKSGERIIGDILTDMVRLVWQSREISLPIRRIIEITTERGANTEKVRTEERRQAELGRVVVSLSEDEQYTGQLSDKEWTIRTKYGSMKVKTSDIGHIEFIKRQSEGLETSREAAREDAGGAAHEWVTPRAIMRGNAYGCLLLAELLGAQAPKKTGDLFESERELLRDLVSVTLDQEQLAIRGGPKKRLLSVVRNMMEMPVRRDESPDVIGLQMRVTGGGGGVCSNMFGRGMSCIISEPRDGKDCHHVFMTNPDEMETFEVQQLDVGSLRLLWTMRRMAVLYRQGPGGSSFQIWLGKEAFLFEGESFAGLLSREPDVVRRYLGRPLSKWLGADVVHTWPTVEPGKLRFELTDGAVVIGIPQVEGFRVGTEFGVLDVPSEEVRWIDLKQGGRPSEGSEGNVLSLRGKDQVVTTRFTIVGTVELPELIEIESEHGSLRINGREVVSIRGWPRTLGK